MTEPGEQKRVVTLLLRVRRSEAEITLETQEENLRWLMRAAMPPARASDALRRRVRTLTAIYRAWRRSLFAHFFSRMGLRTRDGRSEELLYGETVALTNAERSILTLLLAADIQQLPEDDALHAEARRVMHRLLAGLPEKQREVLLLQVIQQLSLREIAQVIDGSEAEVIRLLEQARATIFQQAVKTNNV